MEPVPHTVEPSQQSLAASDTTWPANLRSTLVQLRQEMGELLPITLRALRLTLVLVVLSGVIFPLLVFASLLEGYCSANGVREVFFVSRDCLMWSQLYRALNSHR